MADQIIATGGAITYTDSNGANPRASKPYAGGYKIHTFTTVETTALEVTIGGDVDYLVVAGGGGGGTGTTAGGGGGGGYRTGTLTASTGSKTVTVGDGGANGANGSDSIFDSITSTGGGKGGANAAAGSNGGSGGGGGSVMATTTAGGSGNTPSTSPTQGYDGGIGDSTSGGYRRGGGGGGAGAVGGAGTGTDAAEHGGAGGAGATSSISGTAVGYAGGGGGASETHVGGTATHGGGAGAVGSGAAGNGTANTGGGGGGRGGSGGAGGSGIVIVRYPFSNPMTGGDTTTYTDSDGLNPRADTPYAGGYVVHTYTTVGSSTLEVTTGGDVEYLVVAGGGGGGATSGGGGGGGFAQAGTLTLTTGSKTVTVGDHGHGATSNVNGDSGASSVFDSITSNGGGGGGYYNSNGSNGGNGGGGGGKIGGSTGGTGSQGYNGGTGTGTRVAGGGGGSSAAGENAVSATYAGDGGAGISSSISGVSSGYGGGGGGGVDGAGGAGWPEGMGSHGGGNGGTGSAGVDVASATIGGVNTGGGGGGGGGDAASVNGANGGSGIVIVRYASNTALTVTTQAATSVTGTTCTGNGTIVDVLQDHTVNRRGFCYKTPSGDPTTADSVVYDDAGGYTAGAYTKAITGLTAGTVYKVRAYATDDHSTEYGATVTVTTLGTIDTDAATNITWNSVMGNGDVTSIGASALTAKGICYCLASHGTPDTSDDKVTTTGSATGTYSLAITGLTKSTDYHLRAYATNTEGTFYGAVVDVTTLGRTEANVERMIEIDFMEYATDALAQAEYVASLPGAFQCFSEDDIKTQGDNSLKISAGTGGGAVLTQTGGTVTYTDADGLNPRSSPAYDAGYTVVTFLTDGHIDVSTGGNVEYLVVAGGGGGGGNGSAWTGGGGAGGYRTGTATVTTGEKTVTVGGGGAARNSGSNSVFDSITSVGGGRGGDDGQLAADGGSGGGGSGWGDANKPGGDADYLSPRQGYDGGNGWYYNGNPEAAGGGGGGASEAGENPQTGFYVGADGGEGISNIFSGVATVYSSGGGGAINAQSHPGVGGTGAGTGVTSGTGGAATGYGGGGGGGATGGAGHEGIVILRYQTSSAGQTLTRTLSGTEEICNLSYVDAVSFDMRASRTGSNIKITLHDTSADTEITPNIAVADTWQEVVWDLSAVANANKDDIHQIKITVMDASESLIFYLDNFKIVGSTSGAISNVFGWVT